VRALWQVANMAAKVLLVVAIVVALSLSQVASVGIRQRERLRGRSRSRPPPMTFEQFARTGIMQGDDFLSQVRASLANLTIGVKTPSILEESSLSFVEVESHVSARSTTKKIQPFCEICIQVMQMKERGSPHLCAGLNADYYITCVEVLLSLLRADKALIYWLKNGCMHLDTTGAEIVRPCPALNICSWVPNLFSQPPSIVQDGIESLCPKENKFLPTIPQEYKDLLTGAQQSQN